MVTPSRIQDAAKSLLGRWYEDLRDFYYDIFREASSYHCIMFMARRSLILAEGFGYLYVRDFPDHQHSTENFCTDSSVLSYCRDMARAIVEKHQYRCLLADEIIIQGNAFNELLEQMETTVISEVRLLGETQLSDDEIKSQFTEFIDIRTYARNQKVLTLKQAYQHRLSVTASMEPILWHDFSSRVTLFMDRIEAINATYIVGAEIVNDQQLLCLEDVLRNGTRGFRQIDSTYKTYRQTLLVSEYSDLQRYIPTVRILQYNSSCKILPFVFLPALSREGYCIAQNYMSTIFHLQGIHLHSRILYELFCMYISLSLLYSVTELQALDIPSCLDYEKAKINYNVIPNFSNIIKDPENFCSIDELLNLLRKITIHSEHIFPVGYRGTEVPMTPSLLQHAEDIVCEYKYAELERSYKSHKGLSLREAITKPDFTLSFDVFLNQWNERCASKLSPNQVISQLLHFMDRGIITLKCKEQEEHHIQYFRAGERSLFIQPKRYQEYFPVLRAISDYSRGDDEVFEARLGAFIDEQNYNFTIDELLAFAYNLNRSHQRYDEWDYPSLGYDEENPLSYINRENIYAAYTKQFPVQSFFD